MSTQQESELAQPSILFHPSSTRDGRTKQQESGDRFASYVRAAVPFCHMAFTLPSEMCRPMADYKCLLLICWTHS